MENVVVVVSRSVRFAAWFAGFSLIVGLAISSASIAAAGVPGPTAPAAPTSLVGYRGFNSAEIGFTAGANGGAAITNYKFQLDGGSWTAFSPAVTTPAVTIGGLTNGTTYSVKLRAVNSVGDGAVSDAVSVTPNDVNASTWTGRTAAEANNWASIAYGNGTFVAVAANGTNQVMTSTDGISWTARLAAAANQWQGVTYGNGLFVAVSTTGSFRVMTSPDGITWTARSASEANSWVSVVYGNGLFVAVASSGTNRVMTSPDGVTWTARPAAEANSWQAVTFGNGTFVAVASSGTNQVMTSTDGILWTAQSAAEANGWLEATFGNGTFVAVASSGTNRVMTSPDGITWTARSASAVDYWQALTYGNGKFVAVANNSVMTSSDGITWMTRPPADWNYTWASIAYGNGKFAAVASSGTYRVMTSELTEPTTPAAPTSLAVTIGKGSASVSFTRGADGGTAITNYEYQLDGSGPWTALSPAYTYSPVTISGLTNGTAYTVKLRAVNAVGSGEASAASSSFTPLLRLVTPAEEGTLSILAGTGSSGAPTPGPATSSALSGLSGLVVDASGNTFIADANNNKVFKITSGGVLSVFAGTGTGASFGSAPPPITPGPATSADLSGPSGLAVDAAGNLYVAVTDSRQVVKINPDGTLSVVAGTGQWFDPRSRPPVAPTLVTGPATSVDLNRPNGVAVDSAGNLFILDGGYRRVLKVTTDGTLSVVAGNGSYGAPTAGPATDSAMGSPTGIAVDSTGNLYIADSDRKLVLKVTSGGTLSVFAGTGAAGLPTPGPATSSNLGTLNGIAVDATGNVFITDSTNNLIDKITPDGTLSVVAGTGYRSSPTPGPIADSDLGSTTRVAVDSSGNLYILDSTYYLLEKVTFVPPATVPAAPTSLVATAGIGSASIVFTAGADGGAAITKYQVKVGDGSWTDVVGTLSPITVTGLTNYVTVPVRLRAVNSVGAGAASTFVQVWPRIAGSSLTSAKAQGTTGVRAAFAALTPVGGTVSHYWVFAYAKGTNTVVSSCRSTAAARGCLITGLTANTEYNVAVRGFFTLTGSPTVLPTFDSSRQTVRTKS